MGRIQSYKTYTVKPDPNGYAALTVSGTVVQLTVPSGTNAATLVLEGNTADTTPIPLVWYTLNGETPSATNGLPLYNGAVLEVFEAELAAARFIQATASNQELHIEFATVS
jgi:hypothetical protein